MLLLLFLLFLYVTVLKCAQTYVFSGIFSLNFLHMILSYCVIITSYSRAPQEAELWDTPYYHTGSYLKAVLSIAICIKDVSPVYPLLVSLNPPLSVSLFIIPSFIPLSPYLSNTQTKTCYLLSHPAHLLSHINKNKMPELPLSLSSSLSFHPSFPLSICSADERRLWSLSAGV